MTVGADAPVAYVPGNHDETARRFTGLRIGTIGIRQTARPETMVDRSR